MVDDSEKLAKSEAPTVPRNEKPLPNIAQVLTEVATLSTEVTAGFEQLQGQMGNVERSVRSRLKHITDLALEIQERQVAINEEQARQRHDINGLRLDIMQLQKRTEALEERFSLAPQSTE